MAEIIDYTEARRARALPPTPLEADTLKTLALLELLEEAQHRCHGDSDGDCYWRRCPQLRDGEPAATGRHCPLDN